MKSIALLVCFLYFLTLVFACDYSIPGADPYFIVVSPDGKNVYQTNRALNTIRQFNRSTTTGKLTFLADFNLGAGAAPSGIDVTPDGNHVYVASQSGSPVATVYMFSRSSVDGSLSSIGSTFVANTSYAVNLIASRDNNFVYVNTNGDGSLQVFNRNTATGILTLNSSFKLTGTGGGIGMAISSENPEKNIYIKGNFNLLNGFTRTGSSFANNLANVGLTGSSVHIPSAAPSNLYGAGFANAGIIRFTRDTSTGVLTAVSGSTSVFTDSFDTLSLTSYSTYLYAVGSQINVFSIGTGGALSLVQVACTGNTGPRSMAISPDGAHAYTANYQGTSSYSRASNGFLTPLAC